MRDRRVATSESRQKPTSEWIGLVDGVCSSPFAMAAMPAKAAAAAAAADCHTFMKDVVQSELPEESSLSHLLKQQAGQSDIRWAEINYLLLGSAVNIQGLLLTWYMSSGFNPMKSWYNAKITSAKLFPEPFRVLLRPTASSNFDILQNSASTTPSAKCNFY